MTKDNLKIGTNIYDQSYLVGRVIEVNYKSSRVLLLSDLNSNVPATIAPQNIQAIITGSGENYGEIKYIKDGLDDKFNEQSIVYTSGTGAIFKSGIPIGRVKIGGDKKLSKFFVEFYSDFSQLKYVFAEVITKTEIDESKSDETQNDNVSKNPIQTKLKILEDEIKIIEDTNFRFKEENETLKTNINNLNNKIIKNFKYEFYDPKFLIEEFEKPKDNKKILITMNPIMPHLSNECLKIIESNDEIAWPSYDEKQIKEDSNLIVVQINGKKRGLITTNSSSTETEIMKMVLEDQKIAKYLVNNKIKKQIYFICHCLMLMINSTKTF